MSMAGGWQPISTTPGVQQKLVRLPAGDSRTWNIAVPGKDLTGYTAHWLLGVPPDAVVLNLLNLTYVATGIIVRKDTDTGLSIIVTGTGSSLVSNLRFTLNRADTQTLKARPYWQQAVVFDPAGKPTTVYEGQVQITPSLLSLETA